MIYFSVHTSEMLSDFTPIGILAVDEAPEEEEEGPDGVKVITRKELHKHWGHKVGC